MPTCDKPDYRSHEHGKCVCVEDNKYLCADGQRFLDAGSQAETQGTIAAQDRSRAQDEAKSMKLRLPWIGAGAIVLGYFIWRKRR